MNECQALNRMVLPGMCRERKAHGGIIQVWVTRACNGCCYHCTQGSNFRPILQDGFITPEQFERAIVSLKDYFGLVGMFGGNPALHPEFEVLCEIMRCHLPKHRRGIWCNHPVNPGRVRVMRETFNPRLSNINVHMDRDAARMFRQGWPEVPVYGIGQDSRHPPVFTALQDLIPSEEERWDWIVDCDVNRDWSAMVGVFRGELRGWFCEVAGSQSILHQYDPNWPDYPDTGIPIPCPCCISGVSVNAPPEPNSCHMCGGLEWWQRPLEAFAGQMRFHCHACGVPLRGFGELAVTGAGPELVSKTHASICRPKDKRRQVKVVSHLGEVAPQGLGKFTRYLQNAKVCR